MANLVYTQYDIQNAESVRNFYANYTQHCKDVKIILHPGEYAIEAYYKGKAFETTNCDHQNLDDRVIVDPLIHGKVSMKELRCMGTIFQINSINNPYPECNTAKYPLLDDYIIWSAVSDNIEVQFSVDHNELQDKINYSGTRHSKTLEYLKNDSNITILDEGIMDAADLAYNRNQFNQLNSDVPIKVNQFTLIEVMLNIGLPNTVNDLVSAVKTYKSNLFQSIK